MLIVVAVLEFLLILALGYELHLRNKAIKRFEVFAVTVADSFENIHAMVQQLEALHEISRCLDEAQKPVERYH